MSFIELLEDISDPREDWKVKHNLSALIFTTLCGVLCGAESWSDISDFCEAKAEWLKQYIDLRNGVPSPWTFRRIFTLLDPELFECLLRTHAASLVDKDVSKHKLLMEKLYVEAKGITLSVYILSVQCVMNRV